MEYQVLQIPAQGFASNCWLIYDPSSAEAAVIDPSASCEEILSSLRQRSLSLRWILLTHGHFDHIFSLDTLRGATGAPAALHAADAAALADPIANVSALFLHENHLYRPAERLLGEGETIPLGQGALRVLHTPGHSPGSVCYEADRLLFTGDTLFDMGVGRTDLPGGDDVQLRRSLSRLHRLPDELRIFPGHGGTSSLLEQKQFNVYLQGE